jgi:hypothetical protein
MDDPHDDVGNEIEAMRNIAQSLGGLDEASRRRVMQWASDKFGVVNFRPTSTSYSKEDEPIQNGEVEATIKEPSSFTEFAELYEAADPSTDAESVLVGGYWFQFVRGESDLDSLSINNALKNLGHGVSAINHSFDSLKEQKPALAMQLKKAGSTKQARKKYKLTEAGKRFVEGMIKGTKK